MPIEICNGFVKYIRHAQVQTNININRADYEVVLTRKKRLKKYNYVQTISSSLIYLTVTRVGTTYEVGVANRYIKNPKEPRLEAT